MFDCGLLIIGNGGRRTQRTSLVAGGSDAEHHLEFACSLARSQVQRGGRVLFEHPWAATSWNEPCLRELLAIDRMRRVRCDQCQFGMTSVDDAQNVGPARKATGFMTNDAYIAEAVDRRCFGWHDHSQFFERESKGLRKVSSTIGGGDILRFATERAPRCGEAQGLMGRDRQLTIAAVEAGPTLEEPELLSILDSTDSAQEFRDRSTGLPLNPEMVKELEMQYMDELKVLEDNDLDGSTTDPRPNYRSKLVCQVTRQRSTIDVEDWTAMFAATRPCEAFRLQLSLMMTGPMSQVEGDDDVLMLLDISRAHLHSPFAGVFFVTINGKVYKLLKAMYGLQDVGASFDRKVLDVMNLMGVSLGKFSMCV